ncbi:hypothetical protein SBRCBS47491_005705 [Sporothrix bragantina]|uniref:Transcription factor domain-containing protein n=1 Tax=Sporothrix bragantina TaxID=671064 RepID=A0ABP0BZL7_9PEZI
MIIRAVLADIYGMYRGYNTTATSTPSSNRGRQLQNLLRKVSELDRRLNAWYDKVPPVLRLDADSGSSPVYGSLGEIDRDISASGPRFESYIFGLQRLSLNLAFENTRILLHRPLLSHEIGILPPRQSLTTTTDPFSQSIETCRAAAMRTAAVGSSPSFTYANTTFAAAFFDMHLFTAGVTLCILTSLEPLSVRSHEAKMGVRSLMAMQAALQESSILAAQGLDILKKLITLVLQKETEEMFDFGGGTPGLAASRSQTPHQKTKEQAVPNLQDSQSQRTIEGESLSQNPILAALNNNFDFNMEASTATADFGDNNTPTSYVPNIEFHENPTVARTLMDLEQVIYGIPAEPSLDQVPPVDDTAMASITTSNPYAEQDQGWIWGFDYFQMLDDCMH